MMGKEEESAKPRASGKKAIEYLGLSAGVASIAVAHMAAIDAGEARGALKLADDVLPTAESEKAIETEKDLQVARMRAASAHIRAKTKEGWALAIGATGTGIALVTDRLKKRKSNQDRSLHS